MATIPMRPYPQTAALVLALALAGCVTVRSSTSPHANLAQYRTFAWHMSPTANHRQLEFDRSPAGALVRDRVARDLAQKGIVETRGTPDFLVTVHTRLEDKVDVNDWSYPTVFWGAPPGPVSIDEYTQGTLVIDFIDPQSGQIFWRGTASSIVNHPETPNMQKLATAVDRVMQKYPAPTATATASAPRPTM